MQRFGVLFFLGLMQLLTLNVGAQMLSDAPLKVVNWNLEYFGDNASQLPEEMEKTTVIMNQLKADVYALVEVVNVDSLKSLVDGLEGNYGFVVSGYGSFADSPADPDYADAQKLAFVYNRKVIKNVKARPLLKGSSSAYFNFASGRFPFLVTANWKADSATTIPFTFVILHAKAQADPTSCDKRVNACREMKDTLDQHFSTDRLIILGDYNDDFDITICHNYNVSNYQLLVSDSTDFNSYEAVTLPLSKQGLSSIDGYPGFLDHVVISNEMLPFYVPQSARLLKDEVNNWVSGYNQFVSDHFPVTTSYELPMPSFITSLEHTSSFSIFPNPAHDFFSIRPGNETMQFYEVKNMFGASVLKGNFTGESTLVNTSALPAGVYFITLKSEHQIATQPLIISK